MTQQELINGRDTKHHEDLLTIGGALQWHQEVEGSRTSSHGSPSINPSECYLPERLMPFRVADSNSATWSKKFEALKLKLGGGFVTAFVGECGTGKSQMAVSLAKVCLHQSKPALHVEAMELCGSVKDTFNSDESAKQVMFRFIRPALLLIDEVNRSLSPFDIGLIQRVVSRRYDSLRDTILISNETPEGFTELVGPRVISRINDTGEVHTFTWPSFRKS